LYMPLVDWTRTSGSVAAMALAAETLRTARAASRTLSEVRI